MQTINTYYDDDESLKRFINANQALLLDRNNSAVLVQIFSGICEQVYLSAISKQVRKLIPNAQVIGTTTSGEIMNGLVSGLKTVLAFSVFQHTAVKAAIAEKRADNDFSLGQSIARQLNSDKARVLILFATGKNVNASQFLNGVQSVNADLPVAGGNAGDNRTNRQCFICCNEEGSDCGVVGVVLESEQLRVGCHSHLGWQPIGKEMTITKAQGARVYTIDHLPAYQVYQKYLGISNKSNIFEVVEFPLIICSSGLMVARAPFLRYDDDSIGFFGDIAEGKQVRFSFGHVELILEKINHLLQVIRQEPVETIFVYSCASRRGFLQDSARMETLPLQEIAPTAGFFTSGEFFHAEHMNQLLNTTMTILTLSESGSGQPALCLEVSVEPSSDETVAEMAAMKDNIANRKIEILRALTFLVNTVTNELNERTTELQRMNEQIRYASSHDALTDLYNRSYFNQEMQRLEGSSIGIIMCDVNDLKFINDAFGHSQGDLILQATADILKALFAEEGVVARIGGDEYAVLLPNCSPAGLEEACRRIHHALADYNSLSPLIPLSLSIGAACHEDGAVDTSALLKEADNKMYWEKLYHRQNTGGDLINTLMRSLEDRGIITEQGKQLQELFMLLELDLEFPLCNMTDLFYFARFHDIGKVSISDKILSKTEPLTPEESKEMQRHCEVGYRIARSLSELLPIADWILKHHEWWNGQGYPLGLKGEEIPLECRIVAILEAYLDLTSDQPQHKAFSRSAAVEKIKCYAGIRFDPVLVDQFMHKLEKVKK